MKVIITIQQAEYIILLKYLHYQLDESFQRQFLEYSKNTSQSFYLIDEPCFEWEDLTFEIKKIDNYQKTYEFRKYSELHITGNLELINAFILKANKYILKCSFNYDKLVVYESGYIYWNEHKLLDNRNIDTIYLPDKEDIINDIKLFFNPDIIQRYSELNINHTKIYMLYGIPGTGKTSLIKALAFYFKKNIAYITISSDSNYKSVLTLIENVPDNSFLCLEDTDALFGEDRKQKTDLTFSGFINIFDGINTPNNTIMFLTTNKIKELDQAIIRRVNYFIEFKYATKEQIQNMFNHFFPKYISEFDKFYNHVNGNDVTINVLEKFFTRYLFDNIIEKGKLFSKFINGELKTEIVNKSLYM